MKYLHDFSEYANYCLFEEGLIKSVEYDKLIEKLKLFLSNRCENFNTELVIDGESNKILSVKLDVKFNEDKILIYGLFRQLIENLGYYIASYIIPIRRLSLDAKKIGTPTSNDVVNNFKFVFFLNKKFDISVNNSEIDTLYHITLKHIYDLKIKKKGLSPRNSNIYEDYPHRIYLMDSTEKLPQFANDRANILTYKYKTEKIRNLNQRLEELKHWIILKIDIKNLVIKYPTFTLRKDPKFTDSNAYYTMDYIPKEFITELEDYDVQEINSYLI